MQCENFRTRLHELLDRRERPEQDSLLQKHALVCDHCAETLAAQETLLTGLKIAKTPELSADFVGRVMAVHNPERKRHVWGKMTLTLLSLAAALLMALLPAWWLLRAAAQRDVNEQAGGATGNSIARDLPQGSERKQAAPSSYAIERRPFDRRRVSEPGGPANDDAAVDELPAPESQRPDSQIDPETVAWDGVGRGLLPKRYVDIMPTIDDLPWDLTQDLTVVDEQQAETLKSVWVDKVATPLKPVTNSVNAAINVLRRTLAVAPARQLDRELDDKPQAGASDREHARDVA